MTAIASLTAENEVSVLWPQRVPTEPKRHPSRPRYRYRARGTRQAHAAKAGVWPPQTSAVVQHNYARTGAVAGAVLTPLLIVLALAPSFPVGQFDAPRTANPPMPFAVQSILPSLPDPAIGVGANLLASSPESPTPAANRTVAFDGGTLPSLPFQLKEPPATPFVLAQAPALPAIGAPRDTVAIASAASTPLVIVLPAPLSPPEPDTAFVCGTCATAFPQFDQVSFAVFVADTEGPQTRELVENLATYDMTLARPSIPITQNAVRFYRQQDAGPAAALAAIHGAALVDLTWFSPGTEIARVEIMLAPTRPPRL